MSDKQPIIIKKKKHGDHGHHGGAWKVAYADFVTSMMAFFLVLWIMGLSEEDRLAIQGYFNDPMGFMKTMPSSNLNIKPGPVSSPKENLHKNPAADNARKVEQNKYYAAKTKMEQALKEMAKKNPEVKKLADGVKMTMTKDGLLLEFMDSTGDIFFDVGSTEIKPEARALIDRIAPILEQLNSPFFIDGHTDARPYGTAGYDNFDLSGGRASAFRHDLSASGVSDDHVIAVRANGDRILKVPDDPYDFRNRRVSLLVPYRNDGANVKPADEMANTIAGAFSTGASVAPGTEHPTEESH